MRSWHIARISLGQGEALGDSGLHVLSSSQIQKKQRTQLQEKHTCILRQFLSALRFLGLLGTQTQAKVVLRLYLFESQISKEKCFNLLHLFEGQGWNRVLGNMIFAISLYFWQPEPLHQATSWKQSLAALARSICLSGSLDCENHSLWMLFLIHPILHKSKPFFSLPLQSHPIFFPESASLFSSLILWSSLL